MAEVVDVATLRHIPHLLGPVTLDEVESVVAALPALLDAYERYQGAKASEADLRKRLLAEQEETRSLRRHVDDLRAEVDSMTEWSNSLAEQMPEGWDDDEAQEAIISRYFEHLKTRVTELEVFVQRVAEQSPEWPGREARELLDKGAT